MGFVKVKDAKGREAEIMPAEIDQYRAIGFSPVAGQVIDGVAVNDTAAPSAPMAAANGTDQRLDAILDELRGIRAALSAESIEPVELEALAMPELNIEPLLDELRGLRSDIQGLRSDFAPSQAPVEPADGETIVLKEPVKADSADASKAANTDGKEPAAKSGRKP